MVGKEDGREDGFGFVPALTLVMQAQARSIWRRLGEFDEIDLNHDGELDRHEIAVSLEAKLGAAPSEMLMDNVLRALDVRRRALSTDLACYRRTAALFLRTVGAFLPGRLQRPH